MWWAAARRRASRCHKDEDIQQLSNLVILDEALSGSAVTSFSYWRQSASPLRRREGGYVLLTLLLIVALLVISFAIVAPTIAFEIRRDRELELVHRGVQYTRAIRAYYKKFNRYPTRMEDLENTNNLRFLRKRYKDPITHQDFKLLHFGEVKLSFTGGIGGGGIAGATPAGAPSGANGSSSAFGGSG